MKNPMTVLEYLKTFSEDIELIIEKTKEVLEKNDVSSYLESLIEEAYSATIVSIINRIRKKWTIERKLKKE